MAIEISTKYININFRLSSFFRSLCDLAVFAIANYFEVNFQVEDQPSQRNSKVLASQ
jgi:hypothetical protein